MADNQDDNLVDAWRRRLGDESTDEANGADSAGATAAETPAGEPAGELGVA